MRVILTTPGIVPESLQRLEVLSAGLECGAEDCVAFDGLPARLARGQADLILVHLEPDAAAGYATLEYCAKHTKIPTWAIGRAGDSEQILQALRAGAKQFLSSTGLRDELLGAVDKLAKAGSLAYQRGRLIGVTGAIPGSGVTTVATHLAFALTDPKTPSTALAELGDGVPEIALDLNLTPRHPLSELIAHWQRMDSTLLRQAIVNHSAGVGVLADTPGSLTAAPFTPEAMRQLLVLLRALYPFAVLDLGHGVDEPRMEGHRFVDEILLVVRLDVPSLRLSRRYLQCLEEKGVPLEKVQIVANRYGQRGLVAWKKVAEVLGRPVREWIPDHPATINAARNEGLALSQVSRWSAATRAFRRLAMSVRKGQAP